MPGFPVLHYLLNFAQTHVHGIGDAIQPSHPLLPPSPDALNLSQHQGFFPVSWVFASGHQRIGTSASVSALPVNIQSLFPLGLIGLISLLSKGLPGVDSLKGTLTLRKIEERKRRGFRVMWGRVSQVWGAA